MLTNIALGALLVAGAVLFLWILRLMVTPAAPSDREQRTSAAPLDDGSLVALGVIASSIADANPCSASSDACSSSSDSSGSSFDSSNEHAGKPHGNIAEMPEYPEVEWKAFGIKDSERAMAFRTKIDTQRSTITGRWEYEDEDSIVPDVRAMSAEQGLKALGMAAAFRAKHGLLPLNDFGDFTTESYLTERHNDYVAKQIAYEERRRQERAADPFGL